MPDKQTRRAREFSKYVHMETQELQRILREDASKPSIRRSGTKAARYAMEALSMRRNIESTDASPAEALESFHREYHTSENLPFSLALAAPGGHRQGKEPLRRNLAAVIAAILVFACSITAHAIGFNLWDHVTGWTQEANSVETSPCSNLQSALDAHGITTPLVPSYLPEGFTEGDLVVLEEDPLSFNAQYICGDTSIFISIDKFMPHTTMKFFKNSTPVEFYPVHDITYYLFPNNSWMVAAWVRDEYACCIAGQISSQEMKNIIDSIEKG